MHLNVEAPLFLTQALLPLMGVEEPKEGHSCARIFHIGSGAAGKYFQVRFQYLCRIAEDHF